MPKVPTSLTDIEISDALPKEKKEYELHDGKGLSLLIKPNGSKMWRFRFTSPTTKKRRKKSLGTYPDITLTNAREQRNNNLILVKNGIDPIEKEKNKDNGLFINVMNEWFEKEKSKLVKITYDRKYQVFISSVIPYFEGKYIKDITKSEILHLLEEKQKTATETASRLFNYLSNLWSFAVLKGYCSYNYLGSVHKNDVLIKKRIAVNYPKITDELIFKELVNCIYSYEGADSIKNALKLVLHLPLRASNLCFLKWEYINFKNKTLTIPRKLMKVKYHNLPDFTLPLTNEVLDILEDQKKYLEEYLEIKEFVFIGNDNKKPINTESPNQALNRLGFIGEKKQSIHSFRGSFQAIVKRHKENHKSNDKVIESILDHFKASKLESDYTNKSAYIKQQKSLLQWWSNYIMSLNVI